MQKAVWIRQMNHVLTTNRSLSRCTKAPYCRGVRVTSRHSRCAGLESNRVSKNNRYEVSGTIDAVGKNVDEALVGKVNADKGTIFTQWYPLAHGISRRMS